MSDRLIDWSRDVYDLHSIYLKGYIRYYEAETRFKAAIEWDLKRIGFKIATFSTELIRQGFGLDEKILSDLITCLKTGRLLPLELILMLLFLKGKYAEIICLQKNTDYRNSLLIFTDENRRVAPRGVFYHTSMKFIDGDEDIILGIAKKRLAVTGSRTGRMLIAAYWNYGRKRWQFVATFIF